LTRQFWVYRLCFSPLIRAIPLCLKLWLLTYPLLQRCNKIQAEINGLIWMLLLIGISIMIRQLGFMIFLMITHSKRSIKAKHGISAQNVVGTENGYACIPMLLIDHEMSICVIVVDLVEHLLEIGIVAPRITADHVLERLHPHVMHCICINAVGQLRFNPPHLLAQRQNCPYWSLCMLLLMILMLKSSCISVLSLAQGCALHQRYLSFLCHG